MRCFASFSASLCLLLAACSGGTCSAPQKDAEIALMPFHGDEIAPVLIDGVATGLILDTGADGLTVTPQAVADLKLETHSLPLRSIGIGGESTSQAAEIADLKFGGADIPGAAAVVSTLSAAGLAEFPAYGLFGEDLLTNWDVDVDAAHDQLTLYEPQQCGAPAAPWSGSSASVDIPRVLTGVATRSADVSKGQIDETGLQSAYTGQILFPVTLDGRTLTARLDTGAARSAVRQDAVGLDGAALAADHGERLVGLNNASVRFRRHPFQHLVIDGIDEGPIEADVGPLPISGVDMLIGEDFLHRHRVYIAYHAGKAAHRPGAVIRFVQGLVLVASLALESCAGPPPQPACTLHQPSAEFALPQAPLDIIPVTLGRTTVPFILDTGADASILSAEAGKAMGVRRTTDWALVGQGAGGRTLVYPTRIPVLRLGNGTLPGAMMFVGPLFNMPLSRLPVFGLIGTDIISNWALDLDAEHARLRLYNEEPCAVLAPPWTGPGRARRHVRQPHALRRSRDPAGRQAVRRHPRHRVERIGPRCICCAPPPARSQP